MGDRGALIPPARHGKRKKIGQRARGTERDLWTGCQWKALPKNLPPKSTVHNAAMARLPQDRRQGPNHHPSLSTSSRQAAQRNERVQTRCSCYFLPVGLLRRNRPLLFFWRNFARNPYGIGVC